MSFSVKDEVINDGIHFCLTNLSFRYLIVDPPDEICPLLEFRFVFILHMSDDHFVMRVLTNCGKPDAFDNMLHFDDIY